MSQAIQPRIHILESAAWKDGVITLLEPSSPYRPWRYTFADTLPGDYVMFVLGTDPVSVLTTLGRIESDGNFGWVSDIELRRSDLVDLGTLAMLLDTPELVTGWRLESDAAEQVILTLHDHALYGRPYQRWGQSSMAAARKLLHFRGACEACRTGIDLTSADARDQIVVHTADPLRRPAPALPVGADPRRTSSTGGEASLRESARDWPAVLCRDCHQRMRDSGVASLIDFVFTLHPSCPVCGERRSERIVYGSPVNPVWWTPWANIGGCGVKDEKWHCQRCWHRWA